MSAEEYLFNILSQQDGLGLIKKIGVFGMSTRSLRMDLVLGPQQLDSMQYYE